MHASFSENIVVRTPARAFAGLISAESFQTRLKEKLFREALYLASPNLYARLLKWEQGDITEKKEEEKLRHSLYKYMLRMQTRCTPYGLFAGCGAGSWGHENKIVLDGFHRHTRPDMDFLCALAQRLARHKDLKYNLKYHPNSSAYRIGGRLRYVEYRYEKGRRMHRVTAIDHNSYLSKILQICGNGATVAQLVQGISDNEITREEAFRYVDELIDAQALVSELEPSVTGEEYDKALLKKLSALNAAARSDEIGNVISILGDALSRLGTLDAAMGNDPGEYEPVAAMLRSLVPGNEIKDLFQADLFRKAKSATLNRSVRKELGRVIRFLDKISRPYPEANMAAFIKNYSERYEDTEMPLLEVLDPESGIGYPRKDTEGINPLLDKIQTAPATGDEYEIKVNPGTEVLLQKLLLAQRRNLYAVQLSDDDFRDINHETDSFPPSMAVTFRVLNAAAGRIQLQSCGGPSALSLTGRFAHGSREICGIASSIAKQEQKLNPGVIYAEVVHLPEDRMGNILLRPVFREYEIPYLARPAVDKEHQISPDDLYVRIAGGKVILTSKRLNKQVIPRLSSAHNYSFNSLPVYRFLCDLQAHYYEKPGLGFGWGSLAGLFPFTPRVEYGSTVLEPAAWSLRKKDFEELLKPGDGNLMEAVGRWKKKWNMPSLICLADGDNELLVSLEDEFSVKVFISTVKNRPFIKLNEFLFDPENALVKDEKGHVYTNECIAFLLQPKVETAPPQGSLPATFIENGIAPEKPARRKFITGEEWLYYKIYCGVKTADKLLVNVIGPLAERLMHEKLVTGWFFVRYSDPGFHLRLRFSLEDVSQTGAVINLVQSVLKPWVDDGLVEKLMTDTYNRELERYGSAGIEAAERFFHCDSSTAIEMLRLVQGHSDENLRWLYALRCIDGLLNAFSMDAFRKKRQLETLRNSFFAEHGGRKELKVQLDSKYREHRSRIERFMQPDEACRREFPAFFELLDGKSGMMKEIAAETRQLEEDKRLEVPPDSLLSSFIHMMLNRIFMGRQRTHEMVVYDMLGKYYRSAAARSKKAELSQI